jgi:hypothetical protein
LKILKLQQNKTMEEVNDEQKKLQKKKPYVAFLIDRSFNATETKEEEETVTLMNRLCCRLNLGLHSKGIDKKSEVDNTELEALIALSLGSTSSSSLLTPETKESSGTKKKSLYDTLLKLLDEFDAAGVAEIFRLLLERRTAVPLFVPDSKTHFLNLMSHVTLPGIDNIRLGEDKSLMRIAVVSCRQRNQSQTSEILKNLFNIDSIHCQDFSASSVSSKSLLAEIGSGCVQIKESGPEKVKHVLVTHVIGDFKPLWPFLQHFADYLLIEDSSVEKESFCLSWLTSGDQGSHPTSSAFPFVCVWKPSIYETRLNARPRNMIFQPRLPLIAALSKFLTNEPLLRDRLPLSYFTMLKVSKTQSTTLRFSVLKLKTSASGISAIAKSQSAKAADCEL